MSLMSEYPMNPLAKNNIKHTKDNSSCCDCHKNTQNEQSNGTADKICNDNIKTHKLSGSDALAYSQCDRLALVYESKTKFTGKNASVDFKQTKAYFLLKEFIYKIDNSIKNEKQVEVHDNLLIEIERIIDNTPLSDEPVRFANAAMKSVINQICKITDDQYIHESFGNKVRMDFGTGHELNFLCYLYCRYCRGDLAINSILSILIVYSRIVRKYIRIFNVEAAGARGCWSIDDYQLLPYVFGSSENFSDTRHISYIINGMFREAWDASQHTGMLKSICALGWNEINVGLLKMYNEEVFSKFVVTQHFIYSDELPFDTKIV